VLCYKQLSILILQCLFWTKTNDVNMYMLSLTVGIIWVVVLFSIFGFMMHCQFYFKRFLFLSIMQLNIPLFGVSLKQFRYVWDYLIIIVGLCLYQAYVYGLGLRFCIFKADQKSLTWLSWTYFLIPPMQCRSDALVSIISFKNPLVRAEKTGLNLTWYGVFMHNLFQLKLY